MSKATVRELQERIDDLESKLSLLLEADKPSTTVEEPKVTTVTSVNLEEVGALLGYDFSGWTLKDLLDGLIEDTIEEWEGLPEGYAFGDKANHYLRTKGAEWAPKTGKDLSLDKAPVLTIGFTDNGDGALAQRSRKLLRKHGIEIPKRISKGSIHSVVNKAGYRARFVAAADL